MALHVDEYNVLQPLGVKVLRDSRHELLPSTRDYTEEIPGRPGEYDFGCDLSTKVIELRCLANQITSAEWAILRREIASVLNPRSGKQTLTFADEPNFVYQVRYSGNINLTQLPLAREFVLPLKCDPYVLSATGKVLNKTGIAVNEGTEPCPIIVTIRGSVTNPTVKVNNEAMTYTGLVTASDLLTINTETMTIIFNGVNAMVNYNKTFPKLAVGNNNIIAAASGTTQINWTERWI